MSMFSTSVASITASLSKMVQKLEQHIEDKNVEITNHNLKIAALTTKAQDANAEVTAARNVADKIKGLIS